MLLLIGAEVTFTIDFFEFRIKNLSCRIGTILTWEYVEFFDLTFPVLIREVKINSVRISYKKEPVLMGDYESYENDITDGFSENNNPSSSSWTDGETSIVDMGLQFIDNKHRFIVNYTNINNSEPENLLRLYVFDLEIQWVEESRDYPLAALEPEDNNFVDGKLYYIDISFTDSGLFKYHFVLSRNEPLESLDTLPGAQFYVEDQNFFNDLARGIIDMITLTIIAIVTLTAIAAIGKAYAWLEYILAIVFIVIITGFWVAIFNTSSAYTTGTIIGLAIGSLITSGILALFLAGKFFTKGKFKEMVIDMILLSLKFISFAVKSRSFIQDDFFSDLINGLDFIITIISLVFFAAQAVAFIFGKGGAGKGKGTGQPPDTVCLTKFAALYSTSGFFVFGLLLFTKLLIVES